MKSHALQLIWAVLCVAGTALLSVKRWVARKRPRLIPGWQHGWRMTSVQVAGLLVIVNAMQELLQTVDSALPPTWLPPINATLGAAVILLRLLDQPQLRAALEAMRASHPASQAGNQTHVEAETTTAASAPGGDTAASVAAGVEPLTSQHGGPARPPFDPYDGR